MELIPDLLEDDDGAPFPENVQRAHRAAFNEMFEVLDEPLPRPDWPAYFLLIAEAVSTRGECVRSKVGAVIVRDQRILATGYNGVAAGEPSCLDGICPRAQNQVPRGTPYSGAGRCIAKHAELNAIEDAERRDIDVEFATIYLTKEPCEVCAEMLDAYRMKIIF